MYSNDENIVLPPVCDLTQSHPITHKSQYLTRLSIMIYRSLRVSNSPITHTPATLHTRPPLSTSPRMGRAVRPMLSELCLPSTFLSLVRPHTHSLSAYACSSRVPHTSLTCTLHIPHTSLARTLHFPHTSLVPRVPFTSLRTSRAYHTNVAGPRTGTTWHRHRGLCMRHT